jgi:phytoene dehydrogenase-like protein
MPAPSRYDTVIVGGGHNGLTAAAYLSKAGRTCLLLERRNVLGGAAVSEQAFDGVDAHLSRYAYLVSLLPSRIISELELPVRLARRAVSSYTPDPRAGATKGLLVDADDPGATVAAFAAVTGADDDYRAWEAFHATLRGVASAVFPTLIEPLGTREQMRARVGDDAAWDALFENPLGEAIARAFGDDLVAGVVLTDALIGTFASASSADLAQNRCFLYHVIGGGTGEWKVPVGGMGAVSEGLSRAALRAGAELRTLTEVIAIDALRDRVEVTFADDAGEHTVGAGFLLCGAAPAELARLRGGWSDARELDTRATSDAPVSRPEGSQLKVNMLLSRFPALRDRAVAHDRAFAGTFHVNEGAQQLERAFSEASSGSIPALPPCEAYCHSLTDASILGPELRAAGAQTLTVFALHMPARLFGADPARARADALAATLRSLDSVLDEPIEDCLWRTPAGAPCIEARTPLDLEEELRMPQGHIFHQDLLWPFAESAEEVGAWGVETDHPRILICGAGARRGGAVSGIPGRNAAMAVLGGGGGARLTRAAASA